MTSSDPGTVDGSSPDLTIVAFDGSDAEWDERIRDLGDSTFCHLGGWRRVLSEALGHPTWYWQAVDGEGRVHGALPLARVKSRLFGDYLLSMPFLSYGGPLGSDAARAALARHAVQESRRMKVDLLELRSRTPVPGDLNVSDRKLTVVLDLPDDPEVLFTKGLKAKLRSQVRRPMKEGMTTRFGHDLVDEFYEVFSLTMRDLGTPVLPRRYFTLLSETFPDQLIFGIVEHQGVLAAAGCGFLWEGEYEITWAGARRELNRLAPNMLLYWSLMEESIRRGASAFNFGRCSEGSGTHRFKRQWGGRDEALPWAQFSPSGVIATPNPDSPKFRMATRVWSRLPVGVANGLGPLLSKSLP